MKPALVSGMQPTGRLHIGNYLGALKNFVALQNSGKYDCYFFIADLHSLAGTFEPKNASSQILDLLADYLAAGVVPKKSTIFQQSQIASHAELAWIFNTITQIGDLERMTQFKNKAHVNLQKFEDVSPELINEFRDMKANLKTATSSNDNKNKVQISVKFMSDILSTYGNLLEFYRVNKNRQRANAGLVTYPALMAADILLYNPKFVPVGDDQLQHIELTRTIARRFNRLFGQTFIEPEALLTETPRVMNLKNPLEKMSKSQPDGCLFLDDAPENIKAKITRAVTDSESEISYDPEKKAGLSNLLKIYGAIDGASPVRVAKNFSGKPYSTLKRRLSEIVIAHFSEFRRKKHALLLKPSAVVEILSAGTEKASKIANKTMSKVKKNIGLTLPQLLNIH